MFLPFTNTSTKQVSRRIFSVLVLNPDVLVLKPDVVVLVLVSWSHHWWRERAHFLIWGMKEWEGTEEKFVGLVGTREERLGNCSEISCNVK